MEFFFLLESEFNLRANRFYKGIPIHHLKRFLGKSEGKTFLRKSRSPPNWPYYEKVIYDINKVYYEKVMLY